MARPYLHRRGAGSTVVMEAMAELGLDGRVELDYAPPGVTCPAANALEPSEQRDRTDATDKVEVRTTI